MQIEYVTDTGGDWEGIYLNAALIYEGHTIPNEIWLNLLSKVAYHNVEIRQWTTSMDNGGRYPIDFLDLAVQKNEYKLTGSDSCLI